MCRATKIQFFHFSPEFWSISILAEEDERFCGFAGGWFNSIAFKHMQEVAVPLLDTFHITLPMWQMHMKDKDCSHYCSPGAYEVWTYLLADMLKITSLRD
jgi:hypothetical protein